MPKSVRWQAARWFSVRSVRSGRSAKQRSKACGQRVLKRHPLGQVERARQFAPRRRRPRAPAGIELGRGVEQRLGIGMPRRGEELFRRSDLDHLAEIHHRDPVRDVAHQTQIVGDEDDGQMQLFLQLQEKVDHLRLDRDVEGRDQFVGDEHVRLDGERPGDADALPLAARKFVRIALGRILRQPDQIEKLGDAAAGSRRAGASGAPTAPRRGSARTVMRGLSEE